MKGFEEKGKKLWRRSKISLAPVTRDLHVITAERIGFLLSTQLFQRLTNNHHRYKKDRFMIVTLTVPLPPSHLTLSSHSLTPVLLPTWIATSPGFRPVSRPDTDPRGTQTRMMSGHVQWGDATWRTSPSVAGMAPFAQLWRSIAAKWWLELLKQLTYVFGRDWEKNREPNRVEIVAE